MAHTDVHDHLKALSKPGSVVPGYSLLTFEKGKSRFPCMAVNRNLTVGLEMPGKGREAWKMAKVYLQDAGLDQLAARLAAVHAAVSRLRSAVPAIVPFDLLPGGIEVGGSRRPVLVMPYLRASTLDAHLRAGTLIGPHSADHLRLVAKAIGDLFQALESAGVCHGDLDLENILVEGSEGMRLRLVDFDGLFAPETECLGPSEMGKPDFTSPQRSEHWGLHVDRFTHWTMYVSFLIVCLDRELLALMGPRDRGAPFLFRKADYEGKGEALPRCLNHDNGVIRELAVLLERVWSAPFDEGFPVLTTPSSFRERDIEMWAKGTFRNSGGRAAEQRSVTVKPALRMSGIPWWLKEDPKRIRRTQPQVSEQSTRKTAWWKRAEFGSGIYE